MAKSYDQFCPIARGLDLLGERWTLLVLRELSIDDQRFSDLRRALPGVAPNLLSERLRRLQDTGLVEQVDLPAPAARTVYRLTEDGFRAVPVLRALGRFGGRYLPEVPDADLSPARTLVALLGPWARADAGPFPVEVDGELHEVAVGARALHVRGDDGAGEVPALRTTSAALAAARRTGRPLAAEVLDGHVAARFAAAFALELEAAPAG